MPFPFIPLIGSALGTLFGNMAGSRQNARTSQNTQTLTQDQIRSNQYSTQQQAILQALQAAERAGMDRAQLDLLRRQFGLTATDQRMGQAARGGMLANVQDMTVSHPRATTGSIQGGIRPSALGPEARQMGQLVARQALMQQMRGDKFAPVPQQNWGGAVLNQPGVSRLQQPSGLDAFLNIGALIGGGVGAVGNALQQSQQNIGDLVNRSGVPPTVTGMPELGGRNLIFPNIPPPPGTLTNPWGGVGTAGS